MIVLVDNYDSFTYNLYHYFLELGESVTVIRNDAATPESIVAMAPKGVVLSPGPCTPMESGICLDLIKQCESTIPLLGVCLGHQAIGQVYGATICKGEKPMHAVVSQMQHDGSRLFHDIPASFEATRYHSLIIDPKTCPDCLTVTARSEDGVIQGIEHTDYPIFGVQFHPESIASEYGHQLLKNFVGVCGS